MNQGGCGEQIADESVSPVACLSMAGRRTRVSRVVGGESGQPPWIFEEEVRRDRMSEEGQGCQEEGLVPGAQITHVPTADLDHPSTQDGFITWIAPSGGVYCRFWDKENPAILRSTEHSERCEAANLVLRETHTCDEVSAAIVKYCQRL